MVKLSSLLKVVSSRLRLLTFLNLAFFGCVFVVAVVSDLLLPPSLYQESPVFPQEFLGFGFPLIVLAIFVFNLAVGAFVVVTLPGFVFFPLSAAFLVYRGFIWGLLLHYQPTWALLIVMPTLILEGEAYAIAAVAGIVVGASWIRPGLVYGEGNVTRIEGLRKAIQELIVLYLLVLVLLLVAAIAEAATLASLM